MSNIYFLVFVYARYKADILRGSITNLQRKTVGKNLIFKPTAGLNLV